MPEKESHLSFIAVGVPTTVTGQRHKRAWHSGRRARSHTHTPASTLWEMEYAREGITPEFYCSRSAHHCYWLLVHGTRVELVKELRTLTSPAMLRKIVFAFGHSTSLKFVPTALFYR